MDLIVRNGRIVDGSGRKSYPADLAVCRGRISHLGKIDRTDAKRVIDARGNVVCPGFIDTHSHSDLKLLEDPFMPSKIRQGVTTEILGQDGVSMAPLPQKFITTWRKNLAGLDGESNRIDWTYETTAGYLDLLEQAGIGLNVGYMLPHGNLRMEAMGLENRKAGRTELDCMKQIVRREMDAGALGVSTGLIYIPCAYADTEELIEICRVVAQKNGVFVIHQRSEADAILPSMEEVIRIGKESGVRVHFSHMKICGKKNWFKLDTVFEMLEKARAEGITVSYDQYPYVAGSTMLGALLPPWAHDGGTDELLKRLTDTRQRARMIHDINNGIYGWDNFVEFAGLDGIFITSVKTEKNKGLIGKNLEDIGAITGKHPLQAMLDLILEEENAVGMVDFYGREKHVIEFLKRPEQNVCTDGILAGKPHPRVYGAFPRVISEYVRKNPVLTLEDAIRKMTSKPAEVFGLTDRGLLKEGHAADIVILNPDTVTDVGTYEDPHQFPEGIDYVIINGQVAVDNGTQRQLPAGIVLRGK